jgi:hypothetical protein
VRGECVDVGKNGVRLTIYVNDEKVSFSSFTVAAA